MAGRIGRDAPLMYASCKECNDLWRQYSVATATHLQLDSKLRLAAYQSDLEAIEALTREMEAAEGVRRDTRAAIRHHEETHRPGIARAATGEKTE